MMEGVTLGRALRLLFLTLLVGVAVAYFTAPASAAESCRSWGAQMMEDEGGSVLKAYACSDDPGESELYLMCSGGTLWLSYDLAKNGERQPDLEETAAVEFVTDGGVETIEMQYQEMDGLFFGSAPRGGTLERLLGQEASLLVRDAAGRYPAKTFSLKGSSAALKTLAAACR